LNFWVAAIQLANFTLVVGPKLGRWVWQTSHCEEGCYNCKYTSRYSPHLRHVATTAALVFYMINILCLKGRSPKKLYLLSGQ
jgi:hypothetical protein